MTEENISEMETETNQPVNEADAVAAEADDAEENGQPQSDDTDEIEVYIEDEADQDEQAKSEFTDDQKRKALYEERLKRKKKAAELEAMKAENEAMKAELERLKKGEPYAGDFDTDEEYFQARAQYQQQGKPKPQQDYAKQAEFEAKVEIFAEEKSEAMRKAAKDYDAKMESLNDTLNLFFKDDAQKSKSAINQIAYDFEIDVSKAMYALSGSPDKLKILMQLNQASKVSDAVKILRNLESKVKTRSKKSVGTKPETKIISGGAVAGLDKSIEKAKAKWMETGSLKDHKAYRALIAKKG